MLLEKKLKKEKSKHPRMQREVSKSSKSKGLPDNLRAEILSMMEEFKSAAALTKSSKEVSADLVEIIDDTGALTSRLP